MGQIGSFIHVKVCDLMPVLLNIELKIASDDLVSCQSTFMVEMVEVNYVISNTTKKWLVLFDEFSRATYDCMALSQAILEYMHELVDYAIN